MGVIVSYLLQIMNGVVPFATISILARREGLSFMGAFFYGLSVAAVVQLIVDYGFNLSALRYYSALRSQNADAATKLSHLISVIATKALLAIVVIGAVGIMVRTGIAFKGSGVELLYCVVVGVLASLTSVGWLFFAIEKSHVYASLTLVTRLGMLLPIAIFRLTPLAAVAISMAPQVIIGAPALAFSIARLNQRRANTPVVIRVRAQLRDGWSIFANSIVCSSIASLWPVVLARFISPEMLGAYGVADKVVRGLMSLATPLPNFLIASARSRRKDVLNWIRVSRSIAICAAILCLLALPAALCWVPDRWAARALGSQILTYRWLPTAYSFAVLAYVGDLLGYTALIIQRREWVYIPMYVSAATLSLAIGMSFRVQVWMPMLVEIFICLALFGHYLLRDSKGGWAGQA